MRLSQSESMLRALNLTNPSTAGIVRARRLALTTGYAAFVGVLVVFLALWMWLWHNAHFNDSIIFKICGGSMIPITFTIYTRIRRGFGTFFIILSSIAIATIFISTSSFTIFTSNPYGFITVLINSGLFFYCILSRSFICTIFAAIATVSFICIFWFNPHFITPLILAGTGLSLIICACIARFFITLNSYY